MNSFRITTDPRPVMPSPMSDDHEVTLEEMAQYHDLIHGPLPPPAPPPVVGRPKMMPRPPNESASMAEEVERERLARERAVLTPARSWDAEVIMERAETEVAARQRAVTPFDRWREHAVEVKAGEDDASMMAAWIRRVPGHGVTVPCGRLVCLVCTQWSALDTTPSKET